jgi:hypothetical protein
MNLLCHSLRHCVHSCGRFVPPAGDNTLPPVVSDMVPSSIEPSEQLWGQ